MQVIHETFELCDESSEHDEFDSYSFMLDMYVLWFARMPCFSLEMYFPKILNLFSFCSWLSYAFKEIFVLL